jgi:hypothetical protein
MEDTVSVNGKAQVWGETSVIEIDDYEYRMTVVEAPAEATIEEHIDALLACYEPHPDDAEVSVGEVRENLRRLRLRARG